MLLGGPRSHPQRYPRQQRPHPVALSFEHLGGEVLWRHLDTTPQQNPLMTLKQMTLQMHANVRHVRLHQPWRVYWMILVYQWPQRCHLWNRVPSHQHALVLLLPLFLMQDPRLHVDVGVDVENVVEHAEGVAF